MGIAGYTPPTKEVERPDGETFSVRALALEDITILLRKHYAPVSSIFDKYVVRELAVQATQETGSALDLDVSGEVLSGVLEQAPLLIADVIARAADEPETAHLVRRFSMGLQVDALTKIVTLTLESEGGPKKMLGNLMAVYQGLKTPVGGPET